MGEPKQLAYRELMWEQAIDNDPVFVLSHSVERAVTSLRNVAIKEGVQIDWKTLRGGFQDDEPMGISRGLELRLTVRAS